MMKVGIIGSSGKVAKQIAQNAFTRNVSRNLEIVFLSGSPSLVEGHLLDLKSTEALLLKPDYTEPHYNVTADYAELAGSDIIFVCAGKFMANEKKEQFRKLDPSGRLAHTFENVELIQDIAIKIKTHSPQSDVIIVTNQSDMIAETARMFLDPSKTFGMGGMLDEARFKKVLAFSLNKLLPAHRQLHASQINAEIVGYHNNDMVLVSESLTVPSEARTILDKNPALVRRAMDEAKAYGRNISQNSDPRHPTMHAGASVGPGTACWATIAALSEQMPPIVASFNAITKDQHRRRYGIDPDEHLSIPMIIDAKGIHASEAVASCSANELAEIDVAVQNMRSNMDLLKKLTSRNALQLSCH